MKKLILLGLVISLLQACTECPPVRFTSTGPEIDNTNALIEDYEAGNWEAWRTRYAEEAKLQHNSNEGGTPEQAMADLQSLLTYFSEYGFTRDVYFVEMVRDDREDDWVYFWSDWSGKLAATGEEIVVPVHLAQKYVDGKIVEEYGYYNLAEIMAKFAEIDAAAAAAETTEEG
jgi:hypothetical protein